MALRLLAGPLERLVAALLPLVRRTRGRSLRVVRAGPFATTFVTLLSARSPLRIGTMCMLPSIALSVVSPIGPTGFMPVRVTWAFTVRASLSVAARGRAGAVRSMRAIIRMAVRTIAVGLAMTPAAAVPVAIPSAASWRPCRAAAVGDVRGMERMIRVDSDLLADGLLDVA
jgi:hypothetical protein